MKTTRARIGQEGPIIQIEVAGPVDRERDVSALDRVLPFDGIVNSVAAVASAMTQALRRAKPEEAAAQTRARLGIARSMLDDRDAAVEHLVHALTRFKQAGALDPPYTLALELLGLIRKVPGQAPLRRSRPPTWTRSAGSTTTPRVRQPCRVDPRGRPRRRAQPIAPRVPP